MSKNTTRVFLSYAKEDSKIATRLFADLEKAGIITFIDEQIKPGENWQLRIRQAIKESDYFLSLLSSTSVNKSGWFQKELKIALNILDQRPPDQIFLVPVRISQCEPVHYKIHKLQYVDLFPSYDAGFRKLLRSLSISTNQEFVSPADVFLQDGLKRLKDNNFQEAATFFMEGMARDPDNEKIRLYYCVASMSGKPLYSLTITLADRINDSLIRLIKSKNDEVRNSAMLILGIIRRDYYRKKRIRYEGISSEEIYRFLDKYKPNDKENELIQNIRFSESAAILFNLFIQR